MKKLVTFLYCLCSIVVLQAQTAIAPSGNGSAGSPYLIATLNNLYWIADQANNLSNDFTGKYFKQTADIDASTTAGWNSGAGWNPIAAGTSAMFFGSYDGQGHIITGLTVNRPTTNCVGLFGYLGYGTIQNLGLVSASINGFEQAGGLIGYVDHGGSIINCYTTGSVNASNQIAGGLIGGYEYNTSGSIHNCYSSCSVNSPSVAGGLIGSFLYNSNTISNCYAIGTVSGSSFIGGFIAQSNGSETPNYCFWNTNIYPTDNGSATGKTTTELQTQATYTGWTFGSGNWAYTTGKNNNYPYLAWQTVFGASITTTTTSVSANSATLGGNVTDNGGYAVTERGIIYSSTNTKPIIGGIGVTKATNGTGSGIFSASIGSLTENTTYYVQAYAITSMGTTYGGIQTFTTLKLPTITTQAVSSIAATTATGNGNITSLGIPNPTAYGVCWSTTSGAETATGNYVNNGSASGIGAFTASITGLASNTTYYVKAYATNTAGTSYGSEVSFTTLPVAPTVTTQAVSSILTETATGNGNITDLGVPNPTAYGVCWSTTSGAETATGNYVNNGSASGIGAFTASITGLTANTTYYVKAYATNIAGTVYGSEVNFTTMTNGTFTAATNNDWGTATNWASNSVPTSATDVTIPSGKNPVINATTQASCNNLTVTGTLTIQSSASGTGSLIVSGTSTGTVNCERYITGSAWHVVSPIAAFGSISTFIQTPGNAIPSKDVTGTNRYGMMDYDEATNTWNNYYAATTTDILPAGKGYSLRRASDGIVTFTGDLTSGTKLVSLSKGGTGWNCIGNPYTSAINMNNAANASYNFLKTNAIDNTSTLDPSYACMYLWDDATLSYKILGNGSYGTRDLGQNVLQAGQGFFVKAASDGVIVQFTNNMQAHQTATPFRAPAVTTSWPGITLTATSAATSSAAIITFNRNMTKGLDPTYDAGLLRGTNGLSLYTRLVENNGVDFAIQCLPDNYSNLVIPVGVDCKDGGEITFSAETVELPKNCKVMIEDKTTNTFTSLTEGGTYKTTVSAGSTSAGRFYIHTGANTTTGISGLTPETSSLKAYIANEAIIIEGEVADQAIATLYNLQGLKVHVNLLQKGSLNTLPCSDLMKGIYLLTIQQDGKTVTKKLIKE